MPASKRSDAARGHSYQRSGRRPSPARGLCGFFLGRITFTVYSLIVSSSRARVFFFALVGLTLLGWSAVLANIYTGGLVRLYLAPFGVLNDDQGLLLTILYGLFPISILTAALQNRIRRIGRGPRLTNESRPTESD
jgi:hypothetical protein